MNSSIGVVSTMNTAMGSTPPPPPVPQRPLTVVEQTPPYQNMHQFSLPPYQSYYGGGNNNYGSGMYNLSSNLSYQPRNFAEYNFLKTAEDSSKSAFQSIESLVNALVSVANMLNSTHSAIFNSFKAVIGVIEQFRAVKHYIASNLLVTLIRWILLLWRRALILMRLRPRNYASSEAIWADINGQQEMTKGSNNNFGTLLFWSIAIGGSFFLYKCIAHIVSSVAESENWAKGKGDHYTAQALFDFTAANSNELSFSAFDMLKIAPKCRQPNIKDWILASNINGTQIGLVPINYVKILSRCNNNNGTN